MQENVYVVIAVFAIGLLFGSLVRRWWILLLAGIPTAFWFMATLAGWLTADSEGATGLEWFLFGLLVVLAPFAAGIASGVAIGRRVLPPRARRAG